MKKNNINQNLNKKALLITIAIFLGAFLFIWLFSFLIRILYIGIPKSWLLNDLFLFRTILSLFVLIFSLVLIFIYTKDYLELKNDLTAGVLLAIIALMLFAISSNPIFFAFMGFSNFWIVHTLSIFFTTIALGFLLWVCLK
jgi:hypothetical protein